MEIKIPDSKYVTVLAVSIKFQCKKCGKIYGLYLNSDGSLPEDFETCRNCNQNNSKMERVQNYGNTNVQY